MKIIIVVLIILGLGLGLALGHGLQEEFKNINIDNLQYDADQTKLQQVSNRKITTFSTPLPLSDIKPPPKNSSKKTEKELEYLSKLTLSADASRLKEAKKFQTANAVRDYFIDYAGKNGLIYDQKHLEAAGQDVETLVMKLKLMYSRPRPKQLAFVNGLKIIESITVSSPSYPSGATTNAYVLAGLLAHNNPTKKSVLQSMAKKVELSRLYAGVNFPSDNATAQQVAKAVLEKIKYLNVTH